jgi:hypothetical protein
LLRAHGLTLYEPADPLDADLRLIATWAAAFLNAPHVQLGRRGPVCPYTRASMDRGAFLLARAGAGDDVEATVGRYRRWFGELHDSYGDLLTVLVLSPDVDGTDSGALDAIQARLKDSFVGEGLMVGQFHPRCERGGLWNERFRPLRAPVPLLAIRRMVSSDLPFLLDAPGHLSAYLSRFAPDIPGHVRRILVERAT